MPVVADAVEPRWPEFGAALNPAAVEVPAAWTPMRVVLDAGHGARGNTGNVSCHCVDEQDHTLRVALDLQARLEATGAFQVDLSRRPGETVQYADRVDVANEVGAVFLSLHSDVRGQGWRWWPTGCTYNDGAPGFAVLWSDDADGSLTAERLALARAVAGSMRDVGFGPYRGGYGDLYDADIEPGVYVDRHEPGARIFVLRKPTIPSIIIETHHAWDTREEGRWGEEATLSAFASAVARALIETRRQE